MEQVSNATSKRRECAWLLADPTGSRSLLLTIRQHTVTGDITRCTLEMSGQGGGNRKAQGRAWDCFCFIFFFFAHSSAAFAIVDCGGVLILLMRVFT